MSHRPPRGLCWCRRCPRSALGLGLPNPVPSLPWSGVPPAPPYPSLGLGSPMSPSVPILSRLPPMSLPMSPPCGECPLFRLPGISRCPRCPPGRIPPVLPQDPPRFPRARPALTALRSRHGGSALGGRGHRSRHRGCHGNKGGAWSGRGRGSTAGAWPQCRGVAWDRPWQGPGGAGSESWAQCPAPSAPSPPSIPQ